MNASWNVFNRGLPIADTATTSGQGATTSGIGGLDQAKNFYKGITSGNPQAVAAAAAPAINSVNKQADAARVQQAETGTSRGGGVDAENQQAESNRMAQTSNILEGTQLEGAKGLTAASGAEAQAGEGQMRDALSALGLDQNTADEIINSSIQSRPISQQANEAVRQQWSQLMGALGL